MSWTLFLQVIGIMIVSAFLLDAVITAWGKARRK